jgi:predicted nucleic acid-binding protein
MMNLFIDTNVFLSFYHLTSDDLKEIHKLAVLIERGEIILWLPQQVKDEFNRNRENKISDAMKKLREQKIKPQFPQVCKDYEEYPEIRELLKSYEIKLSSLIDKVNTDVISRTLKADSKISELFEKAQIIENNSELVEKAKLRMDIGNPPGKDGSIGDAINWETLLKEVSNEEDLYLIADDKDYYSKLDNDKLKDFLIDEWTNSKSTNIYFYRRLSQFFKEHYPHIKLASELEKELAIKDLVNSGTFAKTHNAIARLLKYSEFNKSQVNELLQVALTNSQINIIINDHDVNEFYSNLYHSNLDLIDEELKEKIDEEFVAAEET